MIGKKNSRLIIRRQALSDKSNHRRHEAPLCGGHCVFFKTKKPHPETGKPFHSAKLNLSLNLQRFIRHQARADNPLLPSKPRLQKRRADLSFHGDEFALDGEDNWLPASPEWRKFAKRDWMTPYLEMIAGEVDAAFQRACDIENGQHQEANTPAVSMRRNGKPYALSRVETCWEFPSSNPIGAVLEIGAKLLHLKKSKGTAKIAKFQFKESGRVLNSPCIQIPLAENVTLKLYAKTGARIRFEVTQSGLRKQLNDIVQESAIHWKKLNPLARSWEDFPAVLKTLRNRAAGHMNQLMKELRKGREKPVKACSVVNLLAHVAAAVPRGIGGEAARLSHIQTLLFFLCYQRGYRGKAKNSTLAAAIASLTKAGVLKYSGANPFHALTEAYIPAADALLSATGEPLLSIFGMNPDAYKVAKGGKMPVRLRE